MKRNFTAVFLKRERWWVGYVEEVPGANTQGKTLAEARRNLREALELVLDANRALSGQSAASKFLREPLQVEITA